MVNSVQIINKLSNKEYDKILSENIVFLNLVDASAVNTVIECIVRNTPIIVNRHPAVVELLGNHYPLYYDSLSFINISEYKISQAYRYLCRMDKSTFEMDAFLEKFIKIIETLN